MQANKQYSNGGVQYAMYPNPVMNITQTINGYYSHRGTNAIDDAQADTGISNGYAPCDLVCVATDYGDAYGNAMFWQSTAPVMTRSHGQQYITMMVIHDDTADAYVGLTVSQGQQLFSEGTAGNATGNHNHIEVALGQWTGVHYVASGGSTAWGTTVWMLPGNINPAEVFFVDDTNIVNGGGLDWATTGGSASTSSSSFSTSDLIEEHAKATFTVDQLNARVNSPTSDWICRQYNTGDTVEYTYKWVGNGYRYICWYEAENLIMVAVNGNEQGTEPWATFSAIDEASQPESTDLTDEHGWAKYKVDQVNVRKDSVNGDVVKTINSGDVVEYTQKCATSEHRYISYVEGDTRYYVVCSPTAERSTEWADFYDTNPSVSTSENTKADTKDETNTSSFSEVNEGEVEQPDLVDEVLEDEAVTVDLVSHDLYSYKCPYVMTPKTIVIHNAATPSGTAKALSLALKNYKEYKSWHFSVDDKDIIESLPLNRNAFATGDGGMGVGNRTGIQIEIAKDLDTDSTEEWQKARKNGAKLTAILLKKYGWTIDSVSKHQDYKMTDGTYKYCPHKILDEGWDDFLKLVQSELDKLNGKKTEDNTSEDKSNKTESNSEDIKETNNLLKMLIDLLKKIFNLK